MRISYIRWEDVCYILDQQAMLSFYSASSLKQQSAGRHSFYSASSLKQQSAGRYSFYSASSLNQQSAGRHSFYSASSLKQQSAGRHSFYSASSLKQQSEGRHVAPLGHIILVWTIPLIFLLNAVYWVEKQQISTL